MPTPTKYIKLYTLKLKRRDAAIRLCDYVSEKVTPDCICFVFLLIKYKAL